MDVEVSSTFTPELLRATFVVKSINLLDMFIVVMALILRIPTSTNNPSHKWFLNLHKKKPRLTEGANLSGVLGVKIGTDYVQLL